MKITLGKVYTKLSTMLNEDGYDSKIVRDDFIVIDLSSLTSYLDHCNVRVQDDKIIVFTTVETGKILQSSSVEDIAFAMTTVACDFSKDGIDLTIKDGTIIISSLIRITLFTSPHSIYNKVINRMDYCAVAYSNLLDMLNVA